MKRSTSNLAAIVLAVGLIAPVSASAQQGGETPIYGSELMTQQERLEHRERLRDAESVEERDRIRSEHHERMLERARERGVSLPATPPKRGSGMGYDGRERMERNQMEHRERREEPMEYRQRRQDDDDSGYRGSGMGGGGPN